MGYDVIDVIVRLYDRNDRLVVARIVLPVNLYGIPVIRRHRYGVVILNLHILITGSAIAVINRVMRVIHVRYQARLANCDHQ